VNIEEKTASTRDFSIAQAAAFSGLSLSMVNYLCRAKIVKPSNGRQRGRGVQRLFSFGDIVVLRAVAKLLDGGVTVYRLRKGLNALRAVHPEITEAGMPAAFLVTDGKEVFLKHRSGVLELLSNGQFGFAFVVEMETLRKEAVVFAHTNVEVLAGVVDKRRRA
jgi:DNA-binding transcriptional MerR regulator